MDTVKIGTLNLCLGLKNKKDLVKSLMLDNNIDVLCIQELEVEADFDCNLLNIPGYFFEYEMNDYKRRVGCYIKNNLRYKRKFDLEKENDHLIILDLESGIRRTRRIINIYRSFNPRNLTAVELFETQLNIIKNAFTTETVLVGDFNLDNNKRMDVNYCNSSLFSKFNDHLGDLSLLQLVTFDTWSRLIGTNLRSSCLDHIYVKDYGSDPAVVAWW